MEWVLAVSLLLGQHGVITGRTGTVEATNQGVDWSAVERGPHHRVWRAQTRQGEAPAGFESQLPCFTELACGLHRINPATGEWEPAVAAFESTADGGFAALKTAHQVIIGATLNSDPVVTVVTPQGARLRSSIAALAMLDPATGRRLIIARTRDTGPELQDAATVVFRDAFEGTYQGFPVSADVIYRIGLDRIEQDVILRQQLSDASLLGLSAADSQFEIITEFFGNAEKEGGSPGSLPERLGAVASAGRDENIAAADMRFGQGVASREGYRGAPGSPGAGAEGVGRVAITKRYVDEDGRHFLVEAISCARLKALSSHLAAPRQASVPMPPVRSGQAAGLGKLLERQKRGLVQAREPNQTRPHLDARPPSLASANSVSRPGVLLDYVIVASGTSFTFAGDKTYYVSGPVSFSGAVLIEGGAVFKYTNNSTASITITSTGSLDLRSDLYRPVVWTSKDDDSCGETIPGSTGSPVGRFYGSGDYGMLNLAVSSATVLKHVRFKHANLAVGYASGSYPATIRHGQFYLCDAGVMCSGVSGQRRALALQNVLMAKVNYPIGGSSEALNVSIEHMSCDAAELAMWAASDAGSCCYNQYAVTNSIFAGCASLSDDANRLAGTHNLFYPDNAETFGTFARSVNDSPFQVSHGGGYYHSDDILRWYHDDGTVEINHQLKQELHDTTVLVPDVLPGTVAGQTVVVPTISDGVWPLYAKHNDIRGFAYPGSGDSTEDPPDLGYHYPVINFMVSECNVSSTLVLSNSVATSLVVGVYGVNGFNLGQGATLLCSGSPHTPVVLTRYNSVQEAPYGATASKMSLVRVAGTYSPAPTFCMRQTVVPLLASTYERAFVLDSRQSVTTQPTYTVSPVALRDCQVFNGNFSFYPSASIYVGMTNNCFHRCALYLDQQRYYGTTAFSLSFCNNLLYGSTFSCHYNNTSPIWYLKHNLFDSTALNQGGAYSTTNVFNGYYPSNAVKLAGQVNSVTLTTHDYERGPLGDFYYPTTGGGSGLAGLLNVDSSTTAGSRDLYFYTVTADQAPEGGTWLDIGFHYPPTIPFNKVTELVLPVNVDYLPGSSGQNGLIVALRSVGDANTNVAKISSVSGSLSVTKWRELDELIGDEFPLAIAPSTTAAFSVGQLYTGGAVGAHSLYKTSVDGSTIGLWPTDQSFTTGDPTFLHFDVSGVFGSDLFATVGTLPSQDGGEIWRFSHFNAQATKLYPLEGDPDIFLEGIRCFPNDATHFGPWSGKIVACAGWNYGVIVGDGTGAFTAHGLGIGPAGLHIVPEGSSQKFYALVYMDFEARGSLVKAPSSFFANVGNDILVVSSGEFWIEMARTLDDNYQAALLNGDLYLLHWDATQQSFLKMRVTDRYPRQLESAIFAPIDLPVQN